MSSGRTRAVGFAVLVTVVLTAVVFAGAASVGSASPGTSSVAGPVQPAHDAPIAQTDVEADAVSLRATVGPDGTAAWRVTYRIELDDDNATAAFEDLRSDVETDPGPYVSRFGDRMNRTLRAAENATGREMSASNLSVDASRESLPQGEYGIVVYRLDWAGFAEVDGDRVRAGDAIDRLFLDEQTSLTVAWPDGYSLTSVEPEATSVGDGSVTWQGRRDFGPGEPRVEIVQGPPPDDEPVDRGGDQVGGSGLAIAVVGLLAILLGALGLRWYRSRAAPGVGESEDAERGDRPATGDGAGEATAESTAPPAELLSNEERVLALLEDHGGRMKQQQVAEELDWTDAKTSQVVGDLRDAGDVESFRLGRENVLTLPDVSIEPDPDDEDA